MLQRLALGFALASSFVLSLEGQAVAGVITVNSNGGADFTSIQSAVDAAQDGDTILVKLGAYFGFTTTPDKSLTIVGDASGPILVRGRTTIANLTAEHTIVLAGFHMVGENGAPYAASALRIDSVAGAVRVQGCILDGQPTVLNPEGVGAGAGAEVLGAPTKAAFVGCTMQGGNGGACPTWCGDGFPGGNGIYVAGSWVALYDCVVKGGNGSGGQAEHGGNGGDAAHLESGFLHASNSNLTAGNGSVACDWFPPPGGNGGDAIELFNANANAWTVQSSLTAGAGAPELPNDDYCGGFPGQNGSTIAGAGHLFDLATDRLSMTTSYLVREGNDILLTIRGDPGTQVMLLPSDNTLFRPIPSWRGVRIAGTTGPVHPVMILGEIPPSGVLMEGLHIGDLPAGVAADTFFLQVWGLSGTTRVYGSFAALTVLDSAY
jgi:hypothetical protein